MKCQRSAKAVGIASSEKLQRASDWDPNIMHDHEIGQQDGSPSSPWSFLDGDDAEAARRSGARWKPN